MLAALALAPIGLILVLMIGLRWSAARAGVAGLATTLAVALTVSGTEGRAVRRRGGRGRGAVR